MFRRSYRVFLFLCFTFLPASGLADTVRIPIHYRSAADVLPAVESMLSPAGRAAADSLTNTIIVTDSPATIQRIRAFLPEFDVAGRQVRIRLQFSEISSERKSAVAAGGRARQRDARIALEESRSTQSRTAESFITVASGGTAYIAAGKDIPYRERWLYLCRHYAQFADTVVFVRVETGFDVTPVVAGNIVHLDITPRIAYTAADDAEGTIRFTSARTSLSVPVGQWVSIGGTAAAENEVVHAILEHGRGQAGTSLDIKLLVEGCR